MDVLLIKTSSMGDIIHTLVAVQDAYLWRSDIRFYWLVEENFQAIPAWHPAVAEVIPLAFRRYRNNMLAWQPLAAIWQALRTRRYDLIIDAQGLLKSALFSSLAQGRRQGYSWQSAREPLASLFYDQRIKVARDQHAIDRLRQLFALALGYPLPTHPADYGLAGFGRQPSLEPTFFILHGTTWPSKHASATFWLDLVGRMTLLGKVKIPWKGEVEKRRAEWLAGQFASQVEVLADLSLDELAACLLTAHGVVAVDTGPAHLAAALGVPTVVLYGPTQPRLIGTVGPGQVHRQIVADCRGCGRKKCVATMPSLCLDSLDPQQIIHDLCSLVSAK